MTTFYRRNRYRYYGDGAMQMIVFAGGIGMALLVGAVVADWFTGFDAITQLAVRVMK